MNNDTTRRAREIFLELSTLDASAVQGELDRLVGGDCDLRDAVIALLDARAAADADEFMGSPTASLAPGHAAESAGAQVGPYKLLQAIGEGGFGTVFLAEQSQPVRRRVALKIIKLGMDTKQIVARFEAERQALALMDHPHIARVFDAGATESGRPYFAMEYVVGDAITKFADGHKLGIPARLELFTQVCAAVQHAHTKGIIHRDIKPSNVLVSMTDGKPFARVIDFGIAKATSGGSARLTDKTLFTEHRQLIGTPEYMSPEQADGSPDIDTRTDVYALGVLLYELLTGLTPFDGRRLRSAAWHEMQRIIREEEPPTPSVRLSRNLPTLAETARSRHTDPAKLGTLIRGELDWIVMKSLDKDRARRYETPSQFAADVRRHLTGDAVTAAPPTAWYQVSKFMRRHRREAVLASVVAGLLCLGLVGTSLGMAWAMQERDAARAAENTAREAEEWAFQTTAVMGNPLTSDDHRIAHQAAWSERLDRLRSARPSFDALDREQAIYLSWVWSRDMGRTVRDKDALRSVALSMRDDLKSPIDSLSGRLDPSDPAWVWVLNAWTQTLIFSEADTDETASAYRLLIQAMLESRKSSDPMPGGMMVELATLYQRAERVEDARRELEKYLDYRDATPELIPDPNLDMRHESYLHVMGRLPPNDALHHRFMRRYYEDATHIFPEASGERYSANLTLSLWFHENERFEEAAALVPESIAFLRSNPAYEIRNGTRHLQSCGLTQVLAGDAVAGEATLRQAVEAGMVSHGAEHVFTRMANACLGLALIAQGKVDEGQPLIDEHAESLLGPSVLMRMAELSGSEAKSKSLICRHIAIIYERVGDTERARHWREREAAFKQPL